MDNTLVKIESPQITTSLTSTGWALPTVMSEADWKQAGSFLMQVNQARQWWLGDWWNACKWGDGKAACEEIGVDSETASDCGAIAKMFQNPRRRGNLTFSHYKELRPISDPAIQDKLLDWCLSGSSRKSVRELREKVQGYLEKKEWEDFDATLLIDNGEAEFNRKIAELEAKLKEKEKGVEPNLNNLIPEILKRVKGGKIPKSRGLSISTLPHDAQQTILFDIEQKESAQLTSENLQRERNKALQDALDAIKAKESAIAKLEESSGTTEAQIMLKHEKDLKNLREDYLTKLQEEKKRADKEASELHEKLNKEKIKKAFDAKEKAEKDKQSILDAYNGITNEKHKLEHQIKKLEEQLQVNSPANIDAAHAESFKDILDSIQNRLIRFEEDRSIQDYPMLKTWEVINKTISVLCDFRDRTEGIVCINPMGELSND